MSTNRLGLLTLLGAVAAGPITARAESPSPPATAPASRAAAAPAAGRLPGEDENGRLKWDEVCRVRLVGGKLDLSTGLTSESLVKAGITRPTTKDVQMEGLGGHTSLTIGPQMLLVRNVREQDGLTIQSSILAMPGQLTIAASTSGAKDRIVELYQSGPAMTGRGVPPGHLKLTVFGDELPDGQVGYVAPDFQTLWRQHPREANQDLRPLLHHLGMRLMDVDPQIARQALGITANAPADDAGLSAEVDRLVTQLGAAAHKDRDAAAARLAELGPPAAARLRRLDRAKLSPEQNRAIDTLLERPGAAAPAAAAVRRPDPGATTRPATRPATDAASGNDPARLAEDRHFLLDCLYDDDPAIARAAAARLAKVTSRAEIAQQYPPDPHATWETRAAAIERLRDELDPPPKPPPDEDEKRDAGAKPRAGNEAPTRPKP